MTTPTPPPATDWTFRTFNTDPELAAMEVIHSVLKRLDREAQIRVLTYSSARAANEAGPQPFMPGRVRA